jgi:hypothetical protein
VQADARIEPPAWRSPEPGVERPRRCRAAPRTDGLVVPDLEFADRCRPTST